MQDVNDRPLYVNVTNAKTRNASGTSFYSDVRVRASRLISDSTGENLIVLVGCSASKTKFCPSADWPNKEAVRLVSYQSQKVAVASVLGVDLRGN